MAGLKNISIFVTFLLISNNISASTIDGEEAVNTEAILNNTSETNANNVNQETTPLSEQFQIQTDTIKKIIAASRTTAKDQSTETPRPLLIQRCMQLVKNTPELNPSPNSEINVVTSRPIEYLEKVEDVTGSTINENIRGDETEDHSITSEDSNNKEEYVKEDTMAQESGYNTQEIKKPETTQSLILQKMNSPNGRTLFYMYRHRLLPEEEDTQETSSTTSTTTTTSTTSSTSTSTSTSANSLMQEPIYAEQMKFVLPVTYSEPEPPSMQAWKFDKFAYYPRNMQPAFMNVPVPYQPTYHMIRTLTIPKELIGSYVMANSPYANYEHKN